MANIISSCGQDFKIHFSRSGRSSCINRKEPAKRTTIDRMIFDYIQRMIKNLQKLDSYCCVRMHLVSHAPASVRLVVH